MSDCGHSLADAPFVERQDCLCAFELLMQFSKGWMAPEIGAVLSQD